MQTRLQWNQNVLEPVFNGLYSIEMSKKHDFIPDLFSVEKSDKFIESIEGIGGEGLMVPWEQSNDQVAYQDVQELWMKQFRNRKYSLGRQIDRDFVDDLKLTEIKNRIISLADATWKTQQLQAVEDFNNAFVTSTGVAYNGSVYNAAGPDGVALCSASHPYSPTNSTDVQSNLTTAQLSIDAWDNAAIAMQEWKDDRGNTMAVMPDTLLVAPYNARRAFHIAGIPNKGEGYEPGSADHNVNFYEGKIKVIVNPFLKNRYAWFAMDSSRMRQMHLWYNRRKPESGSITDFDTEVLKYKVIGRWSYGFTNYSWVYGSNATS